MKIIKKTASNLWLSIPVVIVAAVAVALLATPFIDSGSQAKASDFSADKSQQDALADGIITTGEYTSAIQRTLACTRAAGGEIIGLRFEDYGNVRRWTFAVTEPGVGPGDDSAYNGCVKKFSQDVESAWVAQEFAKITPAKRAADEKAALACAAEENLGATTVDQLRDLGRSGKKLNGDVGRCLTIAQDGYDIKVHPPITIE